MYIYFYFLLFAVNLYLIVGCTVGGVIVLLFGILICYYCKKTKQHQQQEVINNKNETAVQRNVNKNNPKFYQDLSNSLSNASINQTHEPPSSTKVNKTDAQDMKVLARSNYNPRPYGKIGEVATSPFIKAHNNRLPSISPSITSQSSISKGPAVKRIAEIGRINSTSSIIQEHLKERRNSGYVAVNIPTPSEIQARRNSGMKFTYPPVAAKRPISEHLKQRQTSNVHSLLKKSSSTESSCEPYLTHKIAPPDVNIGKTQSELFNSNQEVFRHAIHAGKALDYCGKTKENLSVRKTLIQSSKSSQYLTPVGVPLSDSIPASSSDDNISDHDYTDLVAVEKADRYVKLSKTVSNKGKHELDGYSTVNEDSIQSSQEDTAYEAPQDVMGASACETSKHYSNLNAKVECDYENFDYNVPIVNPTAVDDEDVYVEFIPESGIVG